MVNISKTVQKANIDASFCDENVVQRLQRRIRDAKKMGFRVRSEWLGDPQGSWCEIAGVKTLFIDLSQSAPEQLQQLEESLALFAKEQDASTMVTPDALAPDAA